MWLYKYSNLNEAIEVIVEIHRVAKASKQWMYTKEPNPVSRKDMSIYLMHILDQEEVSNYILKSMKMNKDLNGDN